MYLLLAYYITINQFYYQRQAYSRIMIIISQLSSISLSKLFFYQFVLTLS